MAPLAAGAFGCKPAPIFLTLGPSPDSKLPLSGEGSRNCISPSETVGEAGIEPAILERACFTDRRSQPTATSHPKSLKTNCVGATGFEPATSR